MTLNDLKRRNSPYFAFFSPNLIVLLANYITVVEDRPVMSVKYCLPVPSATLFSPRINLSDQNSGVSFEVTLAGDGQRGNILRRNWMCLLGVSSKNGHSYPK